VLAGTHQQHRLHHALVPPLLQRQHDGFVMCCDAAIVKAMQMLRWTSRFANPWINPVESYQRTQHAPNDAAGRAASMLPMSPKALNDADVFIVDSVTIQVEKSGTTSLHVLIDTLGSLPEGHHLTCCPMRLPRYRYLLCYYDICS